MRLPRSTTLRFGALVFGLQVAGAGAALLTVREVTRREITAAAEQGAGQLRDQLLTAWRRGGDRAAALAIERQKARGRGLLVMLLVDAHGRFLAGNVADWPPTVRPGADAQTIEIFRIDREAAERMRVVATRLPGGGALLTGHVVESELRFTRAMEEAMAIAMALALVLASAAGLIAARMIETRLRRTVNTARAVAEGDLSRRVPYDDGADVFEALARTVNAMLDRIAMLVGELKLATDGLAHDLRAPLTRLRVTLERALAEAESEPARIAVLRAMEEGERLLAMLDTALRITRAEAGLGREAFADIDAAQLVRDAVEMFGPLAEDRGMTLYADAPDRLIVHANREMLGQAIANLVDNALKYGAGRVVVRAADAGATVALSVSDDGPGIPPEARERALTRFGRLDAARHEGGAGLGLSLVSAVAHLHGGSVALGDNDPGLVVTLTIAR